MLLWVQHLCMLNDVFNVTFPTVNHPWVNPQGRVVLGIKQERNKIHDHVVLSQGIWYVLTREIHTWRGRELICSRVVYLLPERNTFSYLMCIFLISMCVCVCDLAWLRVHLLLLLGKNVVSNFRLIQNSEFSLWKSKGGTVWPSKTRFDVSIAQGTVLGREYLICSCSICSQSWNEKWKNPNSITMLNQYGKWPNWSFVLFVFQHSRWK